MAKAVISPMKQTFYLMRHAKSSWDESALADIDRPLNQRGIAAAKKMGKFISNLKILPKVIYASNAKRVAQTIELMNPYLEIQAKDIHVESELYLASSDYIETYLQNLNASRAFLLIGHNPGLFDWLLRVQPKTQKFPTAALAQIERSKTSYQFKNIWFVKSLSD